MKFGKLIGNIIKGTLLMAAVGALLAVAAPYIGVMAGVAPSVAEAAVALGHSANPAWLGAFFGGFGALSAVCGPVLDTLFGGSDEEKKAKEAGKTGKEEKTRTRVFILRPSEPEQNLTINHHDNSHNELAVIAAVDASKVKTKTQLGVMYDNPDARSDHVEKLEKRRQHHLIEMAGNERVH